MSTVLTGKALLSLGIWRPFPGKGQQQGSSGHLPSPASPFREPLSFHKSLSCCPRLHAFIREGSAVSHLENLNSQALKGIVFCQLIRGFL